MEGEGWIMTKTEQERRQKLERLEAIIAERETCRFAMDRANEKIAQLKYELQQDKPND
jgi:hypothetical protein